MIGLLIFSVSTVAIVLSKRPILAKATDVSAVGIIWMVRYNEAVELHSLFPAAVSSARQSAFC